MELARSKGPVLLLDAGNALFKARSLTAGSSEEARALLILKAMGELKTDAMAAGARDLSRGAKFLKENAEHHKVPVLSANLRGPDKKLLFPASRVVTAGSTRVALIGISPLGPVDGAVGEPPVKAAIAEARRLRATVDLVVVLAAVPFADALQLSKDGGSGIDFVLQAHEGRGVGVALKGPGNHLIPTGERGRQVGSLTLGLAAKGPFFDAAEAERNKQLAQMLDAQQHEVKRRLEAAKDAETRRSLKDALAGFVARKKEAEAASKVTGGRSLKLEFINLGPAVSEDAALKQQVEKLEPPGSAGH